MKFFDAGLEDIYNAKDTKAARKTLPQELHTLAQRKLIMIASAAELKDLRLPPSNKLEPLYKDRTGQYSIGINGQYRICFVWTDKGAQRVEITDYH